MCSGSDGDGNGVHFVAHARYTCIQHVCALSVEVGGGEEGGGGEGRDWLVRPTTFMVISFCASLTQHSIIYRFTLTQHSPNRSEPTIFTLDMRCQWDKTQIIRMNHFAPSQPIPLSEQLNFASHCLRSQANVIYSDPILLHHCTQQTGIVHPVKNGWYKPFYRRRHHLHVLEIKRRKKKHIQYNK